jgi:tetratricopeptide (TPR) repeat protein
VNRSFLLAVVSVFGVLGCSPRDGISQPKGDSPQPQSSVQGKADAQADKSEAPTKDSGIAPVTEPMSINERAIALLNQGRVEEAEQMLRERLRSTVGDNEARILLGRVLDFDGRPEEAVKVWKEGISGGDADFALWMYIGDLRARQGEDGPTLTRRRGTMTAQPDRDQAASAQYKKDRLEMAVDAYRQGVELAPTHAAAVAKLAEAQLVLGKPADAVATWQRLVEQDEQNVEALVGLAKALHRSDKVDEAITRLQRALELNPRLSEAHALLAECQKTVGHDEEAKQSSRRAEFFAALPPFTDLTFSEENQATLQKLNDRPTVEQLCQDMSDQATSFLAALCWSHPHNDLEEMAFAALEKRGESALPVVRSVLDHAQSTCTIRSSARILAAQKEPELFERLVKLLPGDIRTPGFDMDIAGALDVLGDARAVPHLVQVLNPGKATEPTDDPAERFLHDRTMARARAALALGAFDTPESRQALESSLGDSKLALFCRASLYRITRDQNQLEAFELPVTRDNAFAIFVLIPYLKRIATKESADVAQDLSTRLEEKRKEIEQEREQK